MVELPPLRDVIARHGLDAREALGQHFLLDAGLIDHIMRTVGPLEGMLQLNGIPRREGVCRHTRACPSGFQG